MPSVLIDLAESDLRVVEQVAKENYRSRKAQMELIIDQWVQKEAKK